MHMRKRRLGEMEINIRKRRCEEHGGAREVCGDNDGDGDGSGDDRK
jgi:hypothetical protein